MTTPLRKLAVFTGNRAEYGLQMPILRAIADDPRLDYRLLVSGAHLKESFGRTLEEIERDGFEIHHQVRIDMPEDTLQSTAHAIGSGVVSLSEVLEAERPDFLVVYADRFESFAAVIAGTQMAIPTAHIEGGDYTEGGALDDSVRHAMTKLAHLHFTTNEQASERIRRMGEEAWRVHNVGFPALDLIRAGHYAPAEDVYQRYGLDPDRPILIFTQHSVATEFDQAGDQVRPSLDALEFAAREWHCQIILTYPNDDAGGRRIVGELERFAARGVPGVQLHRSLGRWYYHGVLNVAAACLGNSSSGIKETPAFGCACIDIGPRQQGRLRADNVIQISYDTAEIVDAIRRAVFDETFRQQVRTCANPYGAGDAGRQIADVLATTPITSRLVQKRMTY
ncbi:MAG: UDP-N-acetylglucosamine 2-epimerase (hydrolyzing) [Acidobacteria bacterium]|nr:UDP-N-acetylglucosamine 2-epimerase (hydrolyzing) [Acidobacteriota bacterium]